MSSPYFSHFFTITKPLEIMYENAKKHKILNFLKLLIVTNCSNLPNYHIYNVIIVYLSQY